MMLNINMGKKLLLIVTLFLMSGCGRIDPISPKIDQKIENQNGIIEDLKSNQNGIIVELGKLRLQNHIMAQEIKNLQQGIINHNNSGIQIIQGDGPLILIFSIVIFVSLLIYHYRSKYKKEEKINQIITDKIKENNDDILKAQIYLSAQNTNIEKDIFKKIYT